MHKHRCLCCDRLLVRQASRNRVYWFCPHCRQEMPSFSDHSFNIRPRLTQEKQLVK